MRESCGSADVADVETPTRCRLCGAILERTFVDLGMSPLCQTHTEASELERGETFYPLHVRVCDECLLVQLGEYVSPDEIFTEYAYFSSYVDTLVDAARSYAEAMVARLGLGSESRVVEIASNDGYLLQHFLALGVPVLGVEPAANVAEAAIAKGIPTTVRFFGRDTADALVRESGRADLLVGNNVLAHVPDLNDFIGGMKLVLAESGIITMEFPHLRRLIEGNQFDTIYHEHFSYLTLGAVERAFAMHGLQVFDVEEIPNHGGSLRIFARHAADPLQPVGAGVEKVRADERRARLDRIDGYLDFGERVAETRWQLLEFLLQARRSGKRIAAYGAPGKSVTLLNYCGIRSDLVEYTVDRNPYKQGKYLAGVRVPIRAPERIAETKPDYLLVLPWNIVDEVVRYTSYIRDWGGRWVVPIPRVEVLS